jgi:hypothetical protein
MEMYGCCTGHAQYPYRAADCGVEYEHLLLSSQGGRAAHVQEATRNGRARALPEAAVIWPDASLVQPPRGDLTAIFCPPLRSRMDSRARKKPPRLFAGANSGNPPNPRGTQPVAATCCISPSWPACPVQHLPALRFSTGQTTPVHLTFLIATLRRRPLLPALSLDTIDNPRPANPLEINRRRPLSLLSTSTLAALDSLSQLHSFPVSRKTHPSAIFQAPRFNLSLPANF